MLIQNISSTTQAPAPAGLAGNGGPVVVGAQTPAPKVAETRAAAVQPPTTAQLESEIGKINSALQRNNKNLELSISVDQATKKQIVKLTDKDTGDTLVQYPSEAVLAIAQGIDEFQQGLLLKQQA
ncbi:MAG: flagellar protein FlaG [Gallionellaceae bacterium]|nr:flagellar protein FlaG [Gallionellaceae bacterium]